MVTVYGSLTVPVISFLCSWSWQSLFPNCHDYKSPCYQCLWVTNEPFLYWVLFVYCCQDKGVDVIACIAVNDPFVMSAWGEAVGASGKVRFYWICITSSIATCTSSFLSYLPLLVFLSFSHDRERLALALTRVQYNIGRG